MRFPTLATITAALLLVLGLHGQSAAASSSQIDCKVGPVTKTYGGTKWLVYSCNDNRSLVIVSAPDSPASPFYFLFSSENGEYHLHGEGTGDKAATDAAYKDLGTLSESDITNLIVETKKR
jgi:hypothetical protein